MKAADESRPTPTAKITAHAGRIPNMNTTTLDLDHGIIVQAARRDTWMTRLHEARLNELGTTIISRVYISDYPADCAQVLVDSRTQKSPRLVQAIQKSDPVGGLGLVVECDCPAGMSGKPCAHSAIALLALGWYPWPILPTTIEIGTHVRINAGVHTGRCGVVDSLQPDTKMGYRCRVTDPDERIVLGRYGINSLVPAPRPVHQIDPALVELGISLLTRKAS